jgi:hypothetical protein
MKTAHILFTASLAFAMAFTFSCSSGDDEDSPSVPGDGSSSSIVGGSSSSGGGNNTIDDFDETSPLQVYNEDGTKFEATGDLKAIFCDENEVCDGVTVGSITSGLAKLQLPSIVADRYLYDISRIHREERGCAVSQQDAKVVAVDYVSLDGDNNALMEIGYYENGVYQAIQFFYYSKDTQITCNWEGENEKDGKYAHKVNIDAKAGWNKVYYVKNNSNDSEETERSTDNILTKDVKWIFFGH